MCSLYFCLPSSSAFSQFFLLFVNFSVVSLGTFSVYWFHLKCAANKMGTQTPTKRALNKFELLRIMTKRNFSGSYILVFFTYFLFPMYALNFEVPDNLTTRKVILYKFYDSICTNQSYSS